ncbi:NAD-glutamate dehydrogenase [Pelagibacterium sediminicola]|uniref:NAD-glutamate dehydrogenase n=1 Tax=Pelagibacterium sediminicola TaxID=2248761 RepID=UPI000E313A10|nr:NAD-glutamate dehydrogenase [Pelagibacterium sediminicola]
MLETTGAPARQWKDRIAALSGAEPGFASFLNRAIGSADEQDLLLYPPQTLETVLRETFSHIGERTPGRPDIRLWTSDEPGLDGLTIIDIYSADTPFIVDSALAAIRAAGGTIRFMAHPVAAVDTGTTPWTVIERPGPDARHESVLHVHIDTPADPATSELIAEELTRTMIAVRQAVVDWRDMLERLRTVVVSYRENPPPLREADLAEAMHFLAWLADHNFTFLGLREYRLEGEGEARKLVPVEGSGLGILADPDYFYLRQGADYVHTTSQHLAFLDSDEPLMVTKANRRASVHRRVHMDYIGIKLFGPGGKVRGELRILGLFTSLSFATPHADVPIIRRKLVDAMKSSGLDPRSHAGKALMNALDNYPREEMFQISAGELLEFATVISTLPDRPRVRVLPRIDRFDNFVSILVYLPRDRFDTQVREKIGLHLARRYEGRVSAFAPDFPEGELARIHFIIGRNGGPTPRPGREALEDEINEISRSFADRLVSAAPDPAAIAGYANAFPRDYQAALSHLDALADIAIFRELDTGKPVAVDLGPGRDDPLTLTLKVYSRQKPIPLSDRVPVLENFGFSVIDERTWEISPADGVERFVHDMTLSPRGLEASAVREAAPRIEAAIVAAATGAVENDGYNRLTLHAGLSHEDTALLRALGHYLKQAGITWSQSYIATTLASHPALAATLVELFHTLNDPTRAGDGAERATALHARFAESLETIESLDEDRILRRLLNLVQAALRTNLYQRENGAPRDALAIKFDAQAIEGLPEPRPYREIFVYSPRVEGAHMRGGPIARGGLRWSDRPEDFRTEILGLVKAQMVKNAVIVPVGAKGGFVPKKMPPNPDREAFMAEGTACYKIFISALLDVTDNLVGDTVLPPEMVFRRDGDDPYLVVAADKGTASFSDTANAISTARDFWLGDAFASGGSAGYDHKKMGITARGAWETVKRHFREMDIDIQKTGFTVAGVGDMSGDVFGNGMLRSPHIRLVAAFDHRDIFIDPDPDEKAAFAERQRLFALPRSSWQDYDTAVISEGGGVFSRKLKSIPLSPQMQELLGLSGPSAAPAEVLSAILKAQVDLLWFGGIGTYIRAFDETDAEAGDKANDAIRVAGRDLRARVVGEGANLGVTQRGRIEFALHGGRINTDAIDNSAGVNSSDLEVNIKIALSGLMRDGTLDFKTRNDFLAGMTDEVAALCLRNNYLQSLALSLAEREGVVGLPDLADLMAGLEESGALDRALEELPGEEELAARASAGKSLTRPELAVLLAYAKIAAFDRLIASPVPDDPYFAKELYRYFPSALNEQYPEAIKTHRLRREVIATTLANAMINRGGPAFFSKLVAITAADPGAVALAYAAARDAFDLQALNARIDALDATISGQTQLALYAQVQKLLVAATLWFLRNETFASGLSAVIARYGEGVAEIRTHLSELSSPYLAQAVAGQQEAFTQGGTPPELARRIAQLSILSLSTDVVLVAEKRGVSIGDAAAVYFAMIEKFGLGRITEQGGAVLAADRFERMALDRALANVARALRDLSGDVLDMGTGTIPERFAAWEAQHETAIARVISSVADLIAGELTIARLSVAAGLLSDLASS